MRDKGEGGLVMLTFEWAGNVGLPYVVVLDCQWLTGVRRVRYLSLCIGTQIVGDYRDWRARSEVCLAKDLGHVFVFLWVEVLWKSIMLQYTVTLSTNLPLIK